MSRSPLALLKDNPSFRSVWMGQILSQAGLRLFQMALLWWVLGHAPDGEKGVWSAVFLVLTALPALLGMNLIGRVIERNPVQKILTRGPWGAALATGTAATLFAVGFEQKWPFVLCGVAAALAQAFIDPSLSKAIPELVDAEDVGTAVSFETSTQSMANFGGAVLGAVLLEHLSLQTLSAGAAAGYLISSGLTARATFRPMPAEPTQAPAAPGGDAPTTSPVPSADASAGVAGLWRDLAPHPLIRRLLVTFAAVNFFANPLFLVLPLFTVQVLGASAGTLGRLEGSLWVGLIGGAFARRALPASWGLTRIVTVCLLAMALAFALPGVWPHVGVYMACLVGTGLALGVTNVAVVTGFQEHVPDALKGRFFAFLQGGMSVTFPVAYFVFGFLLDTWGTRPVMITQGVGTALVVGVFAWQNARKATQGLVQTTPWSKAA